MLLIAYDSKAGTHRQLARKLRALGAVRKQNSLWIIPDPMGIDYDTIRPIFGSEARLFVGLVSAIRCSDDRWAAWADGAANDE